MKEAIKTPEDKFTLQIFDFDPKTKFTNLRTKLVTKKVTRKRAAELFQAELKRYAPVLKGKKYCMIITDSKDSIFTLDNLLK